MKTIVFDFDHTLFDTKALKVHIDTLFEEVGVPEHISKRAEEDFRSKNFNNYDFSGHIESIKESGGEVHDSIHEKFAAIDFKNHIKGNVEKTIRTFQGKGYKTILLTKGTDGFQNLKLERSGVKEMFGENIIICPHGKEKILEKLVTNGPDTFLFNDDVPETDRIKKVLPHVTYVICKRDDDKFSYTNLDPVYHLISSIDELENIVK